MSESSDSERTAVPVDPEASYLAEAALLRANVLALLNRFGAIGSDGFGWAIFERSSDDPAVDHEDILIYTIDQTPKGALLPVQTVRMITNELYLEEEGILPARWLARDFILDCDNDAQQMIDFMTPLIPHDEELPYATLFWVTGDGKLATSNAFQSFPTVVNIAPEDSQAPVYPLGDYEFLEDKIGALELGNELLAGIEHREPVYTIAAPFGYDDA